MQNIFIVVAYGGQYENAWGSISAAFTDRSSAEAYILYKEDLAQRIYQKEVLLAAFYEKYEAENPRPPRAVQHVLPRWRSGMSEKDITPEMRTERTRLFDLNSKLAEEASIAYEIYEETLLAAQQQYAEAGGIDSPDRIVRYANMPDVRWRIDENFLHSSFDPIHFH
jgi:hypothetical protein